METFESKAKKIEKHLIKHKSITSWEAIELYKATRLSAVIFNLRNKGWNIESERVTKSIICDGVAQHINYVKYNLLDTEKITN